jgi:hypothetical protein
MMFDDRLARVVDACRRHALAVVTVVAVATAALGAFTVPRLGIDTDTANMMAPELPWRQLEAQLDAAFPGIANLIVAVIDGDTPDLAEDGAARLAAALSLRVPEPDAPFRAVRRPDGGPFFRRNGLLLLPPDELRAIAERTIEAQPLIGALAADLSLVGLFGVLDQALDGIGRGDMAADRFDRPLAAIAQTIEAVLAGQIAPLSWQTLLSGRTPGPRELRRFVLVQPRLNFGALQPGAQATAAIRAAATALGLDRAHGVRVRLTGPVPLADEEFASVADGTGGATVLSFALICLLLLLALRSWRLILAIVLTLLAGFVMTAAFAAAAVGSLNLISVAFAAIFFGIAVDFGIQFAVRYRQERHARDDLAEALRRAGRSIGPPLTLAAATTAAGFLSFTPTDYAGVSELGLIAGMGMAVALVLNLTLLPALLALLAPRGEPVAIGFARAAALDRWLAGHRGAVLAAAAAIAAVGLALVPLLVFDDDPLNLKDPGTESVAALHDLADVPDTTPYLINVLMPTLEEARTLASRLETLSEVRQVVTLAAFVPDDQVAKLGILEDLALVLGPTLEAPHGAATHDDAERRAAIETTAARLRQAHAKTPAASRLARALDAVDARRGVEPDLIGQLDRALLASLPAQLETLREALGAVPVELGDLPDDLRAAWLAPDGRARIEVYPREDGRDPAALARFVAAVRVVAPDATGAPVTIMESGRTVVRAFLIAGSWALGAVVLLLTLALRRALDVALVLAPLALAALSTVAISVAFGLPVTYANIITLPLMLGIGVGFSIYFVTNWRAGEDRPLQSPTARAVLFSALTTMAAFGSLALSSHPGTADMGKLLAIALAATLVAVLIVLPALLASARR